MSVTRPLLTVAALFLIWAAKAFWEYLAVLATIFLLPFLLVGVAMVLAPLFAVRKAGRTIYAVTDRRALVISGLFSRSVRSFGPGQLRTVRLDEDPDGSGDLAFAEGGFYGVENVKRVEAVLKKLAAHADARGESPDTERETD